MRSLHEIPGGLSVCHSTASHSLVPFKAMTHGQEILSQHMATPVTGFCDWHKINLFSSLICCFFIRPIKGMRRNCIWKQFIVALRNIMVDLGYWSSWVDGPFLAEVHTQFFSQGNILWSSEWQSANFRQENASVFELQQGLEQSKEWCCFKSCGRKIREAWVSDMGLSLVFHGFKQFEIPLIYHCISHTQILLLL